MMLFSQALCCLTVSSLIAGIDAVQVDMPSASHLIVLRGNTRVLTRRGCSAPQQVSAPAGQALLKPASDFVSAAYYANYDIYNTPEPYYPSNLPVSQLTHVIYAFAQISPAGVVSAGDTYADMTNLFKGDSASASRNLKTLLSIGGGGAANFGGISSPTYRSTFIASAVEMVQDFGFDGLDIDWEFPNMTQAADLYTLYSGLRTALDALAQQTNATTPFLLAIDVPGGGAFPPYTNYIAKFDKIVDLFFSMDYCNCETGFQPTACDNANLRGGAANTLSSIEWLVGNGASTSKIVMGNPLFGYVYAGAAGHDLPYNAKLTPAGDGNGPGTYGVKNLPLANMTHAIISENMTSVASWAYDSKIQMLASYDTPAIAALKGEWIVQQKLAGAMYWEISSDRTTAETSLVAQYAAAFQKAGGLASSCNHVNYPKSKYDNIRLGMGVKPKSC
ncbi:hypothetical protein FRB96_001235 [Tulasnella sp. 330]|nr:hypothetical protein FRB96_001235 [Tulasnella sp. 330]